MSTLIKIIITSILSVSLFSCNINTGVKGNGNITTTTRALEQSFNQIEVSSGLEIYLTQSSIESILVEADENLHDVIITEVTNNILKIYPSKNISSSAVKKIFINFKNLEKIKSASGSDVFSTNKINQNALILQAASGSSMHLDLEIMELDCSTSSGSDLQLQGTTTKFIAKAASGSSLDAKDLHCSNANAQAASGANIRVEASDKLVAKTSSGGHISYFGTPNKINKTKGVSAQTK